jgi:hypothetical protein|eukprot:scaffold3282_cov198-Alexandrium_tamarense.AAC.53
MVGPLTNDDFLVAKEILRRKCLVGLMDRMSESITRFHTFFGFGDDATLGCANSNFATGGENGHKHPPLDPNSEAYNIMATKNQLDIRLHEYAQQLFEEQGRWMNEKKMM